MERTGEPETRRKVEKLAIERLEIAPCKGRDVLQILGGEKRQGLLFLRRGMLCCQTHVIEKTRDVSIASIHLIPKAWKSVSRNVTADQGSLAGSRGAGDPENRMGQFLVDEMK